LLFADFGNGIPEPVWVRLASASWTLVVRRGGRGEAWGEGLRVMWYLWITIHTSKYSGTNDGSIFGSRRGRC
jgi:hypothetical protein